jgi:hypothetical protein
LVVDKTTGDLPVVALLQDASDLSLEDWGLALTDLALTPAVAIIVLDTRAPMTGESDDRLSGRLMEAVRWDSDGHGADFVGHDPVDYRVGRGFWAELPDAGRLLTPGFGGY